MSGTLHDYSLSPLFSPINFCFYLHLLIDEEAKVPKAKASKRRAT